MYHFLAPFVYKCLGTLLLVYVILVKNIYERKSIEKTSKLISSMYFIFGTMNINLISNKCIN